MEFRTDEYCLLTEEQSRFLRTFFGNCPEYYSDMIVFKNYPKDRTIICMDDEDCSYVYILLDGMMQAIEEKAETLNCNLTEIKGISIIGDHELFAPGSGKMIFLKTLEESKCLIIPAKAYIAWIQSDTEALKIRMQMLLEEFLNQTTCVYQEISFTNQERFLLFLVHECTGNDGQNDVVTVSRTHQEIAERLRCSRRTVNRMIDELSRKGIVSLYRGKMQLSIGQCDQIKALVKKCILNGIQIGNV